MTAYTGRSNPGTTVQTPFARSVGATGIDRRTAETRAQDSYRIGVAAEHQQLGAVSVGYHGLGVTHGNAGERPRGEINDFDCPKKGKSVDARGGNCGIRDWVRGRDHDAGGGAGKTHVADVVSLTVSTAYTVFVGRVKVARILRVGETTISPGEVPALQRRDPRQGIVLTVDEDQASRN